MMEDMKDALQTAITGANHAQLSIMYKALQKECERLKANLESKTEIANQLKDGMADMFEKNIALQAECDSLAAQVANLNNYIVAITHADETGYVDGVGFVEDFSDIQEQVRVVVAAHDAEVAKAAVLEFVQFCRPYGNLMDYPQHWVGDKYKEFKEIKENKNL